MITNDSHLVARICGDVILVIAKSSGKGGGGSLWSSGLGIGVLSQLPDSFPGGDNLFQPLQNNLKRGPQWGTCI